MEPLTAADKAKLASLQDVQEVLRHLVIALGALNPQAMPKVAHLLRAATGTPQISGPARVMLWDLADGVDLATGQDTEH